MNKGFKVFKDGKEIKADDVSYACYINSSDYDNFTNSFAVDENGNLLLLINGVEEDNIFHCTDEKYEVRWNK